jgi:hypothetical protein
MVTDCVHGAMYAQLETGDEIERTPVELGDGVLHPGEFVSRLGERKRSSFEMQEGFFLRYVGKIGKTLLFNVNNYEDDDIFYAFNYLSPSKLLVVGRGKGWDINIEHLEKVPNPQFKKKTVYQQLELDLR